MSTTSLTLLPRPQPRPLHARRTIDSFNVISLRLATKFDRAPGCGRRPRQEIDGAFPRPQDPRERHSQLLMRPLESAPAATTVTCPASSIRIAGSRWLGGWAQAPLAVAATSTRTDAVDGATPANRKRCPASVGRRTYPKPPAPAPHPHVTRTPHPAARSHLGEWQKTKIACSQSRPSRLPCPATLAIVQRVIHGHPCRMKPIPVHRGRSHAVARHLEPVACACRHLWATFSLA